MTDRFEPSQEGMKAWFYGSGAQMAAYRKALEVVAAAQAIAPVGQPPDDHHPGAYRDSIHVGEAYLGRTRVVVPVIASIRYAHRVEVSYGYHTLARAAGLVNDPGPWHNRQIPPDSHGLNGTRGRSARPGGRQRRTPGHRSRTGGRKRSRLVARLIPGRMPFKGGGRASLRRALMPGGNSFGPGGGMFGGGGGLFAASALFGGGGGGGPLITVISPQAQAGASAQQTPPPQPQQQQPPPQQPAGQPGARGSSARAPARSTQQRPQPPRRVV